MYMKKSVFIMFFIAISLFSVNTVLAQAPNATIMPSGGVQASLLGIQGNITNTDTLVNTVMALVGWVAWFVGLLAVVSGLYSGILFITGGGNADKIVKARNVLLYSIIGIAVAVLAFGLVAVSRSIFGI